MGPPSEFMIVRTPGTDAGPCRVAVSLTDMACEDAPRRRMPFSRSRLGSSAWTRVGGEARRSRPGENPVLPEPVDIARRMRPGRRQRGVLLPQAPPSRCERAGRGRSRGRPAVEPTRPARSRARSARRTARCAPGRTTAIAAGSFDPERRRRERSVNDGGACRPPQRLSPHGAAPGLRDPRSVGAGTRSGGADGTASGTCSWRVPPKRSALPPWSRRLSESTPCQCPVQPAWPGSR